MPTDPPQVRPDAPENRTSPPPLPDRQKNGAPQNGEQSDAHQAAAHQDELPDINVEPIGTGRVIIIAIGFGVLLLAIFLVGLVPHHRREAMIEAEAKKSNYAKPAVATTQPYRAQRQPALILPGDVRAFQTTALFARANGYLKDQTVDIGDHVKAGQLLAQIEIPEVDAQLLSSKATLEQAKAAAGRAEDDYKLAQTTLDRYEGLSKSGGVTQQQLDEKRSAFTQMKSGLAGAATVRGDEAEVQRLTATQNFGQITAPFSGKITSRNYDIGALVSASETAEGHELFRLEETDTLRVFVNVPQTYAEQVKVDDDAEFLVNNFPGRSFKGKIARTSGSIDTSTRTLRVEADFPNPDGMLLPGMYGELRYLLKQGQSPPLMLPTSALIFGADGMRVASVDENSRVKFVNVKPGRDLGTEIEIVAGLSGEERVISNPGERLVEGLEVDTTNGGREAPQAPPANAGKSETTSGGSKVAEGDSRR